MSNRGIWLTFSTSFNLGVPARKTGNSSFLNINLISFSIKKAEKVFSSRL